MHHPWHRGYIDAIMASMKPSLEEVCKAVNITKDDYNHAKALAGEN